MTSRLEKFSEGVRRVLSLAQEEAISLKQDHILPEHLLFGLMLYMVELKTGISKRRDQRYYITLSLAPDTQAVIMLAVAEAQEMGHSLVRPEHLLIGLILEGESVAAGILKILGVTLKQMRAETLKMYPLLQE